MDNTRKETIAKEAIKSLVGKPEGEDSIGLFVEHHLAELEPGYFSNICGTPTPDAEKISHSLVLVGSWSSADDGQIDVFDFSLPDEVTNYVLSVRFSGEEVEEVSMES